MRAQALFLVLISTVFGQARAAFAAQPTTQPSTRPIAFFSGWDSHVENRECERITSNEAWKKTWLTHLGLNGDTIHRPEMDVDFDRCIVIASFSGKCFNCAGYTVDSIDESDDRIRIRLLPKPYQTSSQFTSAGRFDTTLPGTNPSAEDETSGGAQRVKLYAFVVLPKSDKLIVVEEDHHSLMGDPPHWIEVARLSAVHR